MQFKKTYHLPLSNQFQCMNQAVKVIDKAYSKTAALALYTKQTTSAHRHEKNQNF